MYTHHAGKSLCRDNKLRNADPNLQTWWVKKHPSSTVNTKQPRNVQLLPPPQLSFHFTAINH